MIGGVISFYASARSLQIGEAVEVIAITSVAANLAAIIGGILIFDDPIGSGPSGIAARCIAFCLVIVGAALMPAPMRAAPDTACAADGQQLTGTWTFEAQGPSSKDESRSAVR